MDDLTEAERQLIEILREQSGDSNVDIRLWFADQKWRIAMYTVANFKSLGGQGVGDTFDEAWMTCAPDWSKRPNLRLVERPEG